MPLGQRTLQHLHSRQGSLTIETSVQEPQGDRLYALAARNPAHGSACLNGAVRRVGIRLRANPEMGFHSQADSEMGFPSPADSENGFDSRAKSEMGRHSQADSKVLRQWLLRWLPRASEMHSLKLSIGDVLWRSNLHFQRGRIPGLPHVASCSVSPVQDQTTWAFGSKDVAIMGLWFENPTQ